MSTSRPGYHHGDLRRALTDAAASLLREGGTQALSLRAAARRAGVSAMAPYRHFPGKESLLAAVAAQGFGRLAERLGQADATAQGVEALVAQGVAYVGFACDEPALFRLMFGSAPPKDHPDLRVAGDAAYAVLARRAADLAEAGDQGDLALACWSLVHGLASLLVDGHALDAAREPAAIAARVARLMLRGVGPDRAPPNRR